MASDRGTETFFVISKGEIGSEHDTEYLKADGSAFGDAPRCEVCGQFVNGRRWLSPFRVELTLHGSSWGDFAFFGDGDFVVSERAARLFREAGLTGLQGFETVEIAQIRGSNQQPPSYLPVTVARSEAAVDERRSSLIRPETVTCDRCRSGGLEGIRGFVLAPGTWTGEDVFFARGLGGVLIATSRFRDLVGRHGLTNIRLTPTESYLWDPYAPISGAA